MAEPLQTDRARLAALIVEALDRIATPAARFEIIDRALLLAQRDSLPTSPRELFDFVDVQLYEAVLAILGREAAEGLHEHLGMLIARAGYDAEPAPQSAANTLKPPRPKVTTSDVVPASGRLGSGAFVKPREVRTKTPSNPGRHSTLSYDERSLFETPGDKLCVMVVDDDPNYRRALVRLLNGEGYEVNGAPNGDTALWMCERLKPDLIVTDYELGDTDGMALADEIRRRMGDQTPPIIVVTASAALPKNQGSVNRVMLKSVDDGSLVNAVAELLRRDD